MANIAQQAPVPSTTSIMFRIFLIALIASIAGLGGVMYINQQVKIISGKVIDVFSETEFASRKSSYQQEVAMVEYSVDGKAHTGKSAVPRKKQVERGSLVPTYYYPQLPQFAWFFNKENGIDVYFGLVLFVSAVGMAFSLHSLLKRRKAALAAAVKKQPAKTAKSAQPDPNRKKS